MINSRTVASTGIFLLALGSYAAVAGAQEQRRDGVIELAQADIQDLLKKKREERQQQQEQRGGGGGGERREREQGRARGNDQQDLQRQQRQERGGGREEREQRRGNDRPPTQVQERPERQDRGGPPQQERREDRRPPVQVQEPRSRQDDRRPPIQVEEPRGRNEDRRPPQIQGRDRRDGPPQVEERRRGDDRPPPVQVERDRRDEPRGGSGERRGLESFRERFKSRVGEDKQFQDFRRGRDERVRERRERTREATPFRGFDDLKAKRRERRDGNAVVIEEPDKRVIVRDGGRAFIRTDENERLRRNFRDVRREKRDGRDVTIAIGAGGAQIFTDFDDDGRTRRRWRRGPDGREIVLFDNSRSSRWRSRHGHRYGGFFDNVIDLPPPRLRIPRDEYIVDYDRASEDDLYDALNAPPVEEIDDRYSLDEIRSSYSLRDRMRRIDLDTINFAFGSWEVEEQDYDRLERVARAMRRVLRRNADEMFLIEGHTDAVGSDEDNLTLSDRRAESVARILSEEFQVPAENLTTQGYGEQFLKIDTSEPERQNRRVAIRRITPLLAR